MAPDKFVQDVRWGCMDTEISKDGRIRLGGAEIDFNASRIRTDEGERNVEPKILEVLRVLADRRGDVVSRDELISIVWGVKAGGDERLTRSISLLRKALGGKEHIKTIPKRGYCLVTPVETDQAARTNGTIVSERPALAAARSIAVLPFTNLSDHQDGPFLAEGLSEDLLNALNQIDAVQVTGRNSAFAFEQDISDITQNRRHTGCGLCSDGFARLERRANPYHRSVDARRHGSTAMVRTI